MADSIVFKYTEMRNAAKEIRDTIGARYKSSADTLKSDFSGAIKGWEGESKEALESFMNGAVYVYTHETIPQMMEALAALLEANASTMENADKEIAENIPQSLS